MTAITTTRRMPLGPLPGEPLSETRENILIAARKVLIREGHTRLTTRAVAKQAGITVGNLTYHFPSKQDLLRALIKRLLAEYVAGFDAFFADFSSPPEEMFKALIDWLMSDAAMQGTYRTFRELWVLALHDPAIAHAIDEFYDETMERIVRLLRRSHPGLSNASAAAVVQMLALISEGTAVLYGTNRARKVDLDTAKALAVEMLTDAIKKASRN